MGITFKEDVPDIRNSKVVDLIKELMDYSINVHVVDPLASANEVAKEHGISLMDEPQGDYDAVVLAVGHSAFRALNTSDIKALCRQSSKIFDIKGILAREDFDFYWKL